MSGLGAVKPARNSRWSGQPVFQFSGKLESPAKLVFFTFDRLRTELPFTFHDLPLP
jgi:hypothetical protein